MSEVNTLQALYVEELKDLWSANDQMARALKKITPNATNKNLKSMLNEAPIGIQAHTEMLKTLIEAQNGELSKEHCKGMEGLCSEAIKHTIDEAPKSGPVLDAAIIAQYQRMTHYGITGFGTAAAFAKALDLDDDAEKLSDAVETMYDADELMSELAEGAVNADAIDG
jgi:ferritin-like metal-binding protein YciE